MESDVSALTLQEDLVTMLAFTLMPEVIATMALMNVSTPSTWNNIETYTREMLMRSYAASWTAITDASSSSSPRTMETKARIAVPNVIAIVATWRVALWFWMQMLLTSSAVIFIMMQVTSRKGLVAHPMLEWFLLDTQEVRGKMDVGEKGGMMRLTREGDFSTIRYADDAEIVVPGSLAPT